MRDVNELVKFTEDAINLAIAQKTKLSPEVLAIRGHGSLEVSAFLNNLCASLGECRYLEFGVFTGRSLVAAASGNKGSYVGVDRLTWLGSSIRFKSVDDLKAQLTTNLALIPRDGRYPAPPYAVLEMDTADFKPEGNYDVFFYDADHSMEPTRDGIRLLLPHLKPGVVIVDDWLTHKKSPEVQQGTLHALAGTDIIKSWQLPWHTGLYVAVLA